MHAGMHGSPCLIVQVQVPRCEAQEEAATAEFRWMAHECGGGCRIVLEDASNVAVHLCFGQATNLREECSVLCSFLSRVVCVGVTPASLLQC